jgi:formiminotetrahydrofolate cyclodeaminase
MSRIWENTLSSFLDSIASSSPTPGGGSVSAVTGAFGLALVIMALEVTSAKVEGEKLQKVSSFIEQKRKLLKDIKNYPQRDIDAFDRYMGALKLPKATQEEKTARAAALQAAVLEATIVPLETARLFCTALDLTAQSAALVDKNITSDVGAGGELIAASLRAVLLNVDINSPSIKDETLKAKLCNERKNLENQANQLVKQIIESIKSA